MDHEAVWNACRRQIVEATYNAPHSQPPVNICGHEGGHRIEIYGETVDVIKDFKVACVAYDVARLAAAKALLLLNRTLAGKEG